MHTPEDDVYLGRYVLEKNLVSREALLECLFQTAQERKSGARPGYARPLGVVLLAHGLLTEDDLNRILAERLAGPKGGGTLSEAEVGKLLVGAGLVLQEEIDDCIRVQKDMRASGKPPLRLGQLVVQRGLATEQQVMRVLAYQKRVPFSCSGCGVRVTATPPPPGTRYRCKKCGGTMVRDTAAAGTAPAPGETLTMREAAHGEDRQAEIDRAVVAFMRQKGMVRRDQLREAQRMQMEFGRFGMVVPLMELLRRAGAVSLQQMRELRHVDFDKIVQAPDWKGQAIPGYRVLGRVASGGYATIYEAEAMFGGGKVAVKVLHPERAKDRRTVQRFERESALLREFDCPKIVHGLEYGAERGNHFLVMELVHGRTLGQALSESGPFPLRGAVSAARQVAEGLRYLHAVGYAHRDVKPDNVLVDDQGQAKLCDLGFAAALEEGPGGAGRTVQVSADLYALGVLCFALLTAQDPFTGASSDETAADQIESDLPVPNLMVVQGPRELVGLIKRLTHPDPHRRFASADEVLKAIDGLPV